jgi:hypothetical protein
VEDVATDSDSQQNENDDKRSTVIRAAVAAAATGAAAYGVHRIRGSHEEEPGDGDDDSSTDDQAEDADEGEGPSGKREELTQALTAKVSDAKKAATRLKPGGGGRRSALDTAWDAASDHLLPVAGEAAATLGATVAKKAPEIVRDKLLPRFIEGFQKEAG